MTRQEELKYFRDGQAASDIHAHLVRVVPRVKVEIASRMLETFLKMIKFTDISPEELSDRINKFGRREVPGFSSWRISLTDRTFRRENWKESQEEIPVMLPGEIRKFMEENRTRLRATKIGI